MDHHTVAAEACLLSFTTRAQKKAAGPVHAALAASVAHQMTGLMEMVLDLQSRGQGCCPDQSPTNNLLNRW